MGDALFFIAVIAAFVIFSGEPDIADAWREQAIAQAKCK